MNIAIVGAGVIGVTTAYELADDGHAVTVFERHSAAAEEASFAAAGVIAPGHLAGWATSATPEASAGWPPPWGQLAWARAARRGRHSPLRREARGQAQRLAVHSRDRLHALTQSLQLEYDCSPGYLLLYRGERERRRAQPWLEALRQAEVRFEELSPEAARAIEPALNPSQDFAGAVHLPDDGVANCRQFAQLLRRHAQARGARFEFGCTVLPLDPAAPALLRLQGPTGPDSRRFDAVVVCAGLASAALLRPVGLRLPLAPVWGQTVTATIGEPMNAPLSALRDEQHQVDITRLGERVRVSGGARLGEAGAAKDAALTRTLYQVLQDWFPAAARLAGDYVTVQEWQGARPTLPDGAPVLGASGAPGVWLNLGHGANGWSMACGSARALADSLAGREPAVDLAALGPHRLRSAG